VRNAAHEAAAIGAQSEGFASGVRLWFGPIAPVESSLCLFAERARNRMRTPADRPEHLRGRAERASDENIG
jgi:hypothetical protein